MLDTKEKALCRLKELNIPYELFEHEAVFTIEEMTNIALDTDAHICKNLFVRNQKGDRHYLIVLRGDKRADLLNIGEKIGAGKLSFASADRLYKYLALEKGEVTPLALINDENAQVTVIFDKDLYALKRVGVHPNTNTATVVLTFGDLLRYVGSFKNETMAIEI